jgi:hypothetical protein
MKKRDRRMQRTKEEPSGLGALGLSMWQKMLSAEL